MTQLTYVECPRDAWQGFARFIPTDTKRAYLEALLAAGFRHLDLGSFVSPKAVPQLADTEAVLAGLERPEGADFLCIIANERGLERALGAKGVTSVGFPLSVNETFQQRNAGTGLAEAWALVERLHARTLEHGLGFVVYVSMGFGNPYGEPWAPEDTSRAVARLRALGVRRIALADTIGNADAERVAAVLAAVGEVEGLGLHLHAREGAWRGPVEAGLARGVRWFEGALGGVGGCPFAGDALVGNLPSERLLVWLSERGFDAGISLAALPALTERALQLKSAYQG